MYSYSWLNYWSAQGFAAARRALAVKGFVFFINKREGAANDPTNKYEIRSSITHTNGSLTASTSVAWTHCLRSNPIAASSGPRTTNYTSTMSMSINLFKPHLLFLTGCLPATISLIKTSLNYGTNWFGGYTILMLNIILIICNEEQQWTSRVLIDIINWSTWI